MSLLARTIALAALLGAAYACGDDGPAPETETRRMQTPTLHTTSDAQPLDAQPVKPANGSKTEFYIDTATEDTWRPSRKSSTPPRVLRLTLRSTPPGATALVDGTPIGVTPTYWEGPATGKPRNFVFTLPGYVMARYRFVPTTHGVVHATLKKLTATPPDAGPEDVGR